jgi:hypothetical protein
MLFNKKRAARLSFTLIGFHPETPSVAFRNDYQFNQDYQG